ncbi:MAG: hypothetical protein R3F62_28745 [Planctomycetota bacterium]
MNEKTQPEPARPVDPELAEAVRQGVKAQRCPYCHEDCAAEGSVVCSGCLARHHTACWDEAHACSACGATQRLVQEGPPPRPADGELLDLLYRKRAAQARQRLVQAGLSAEDADAHLRDLAFAELARLPTPAVGPQLKLSLVLSALLIVPLALGTVMNFSSDPKLGIALAALGVVLHGLLYLGNFALRPSTINRWTLAGVAVDALTLVGLATTASMRGEALITLLPALFAQLALCGRLFRLLQRSRPREP